MKLPQEAKLVLGRAKGRGQAKKVPRLQFGDQKLAAYDEHVQSLDSTMTMDQKYLGSCPAGVQPGDLTSADGKVTHLWNH
jgi:hypothetical protein